MADLSSVSGDAMSKKKYAIPTTEDLIKKLKTKLPPKFRDGDITIEIAERELGLGRYAAATFLNSQSDLELIQGAVLPSGKIGKIWRPKP